jgi:hypothetical protein
MRHGRSSENQIIGVLRERKAEAKTSPRGRRYQPVELYLSQSWQFTIAGTSVTADGLLYR